MSWLQAVNTEKQVLVWLPVMQEFLIQTVALHTKLGNQLWRLFGIAINIQKYPDMYLYYNYIMFSGVSIPSDFGASTK